MRNLVRGLAVVLALLVGGVIGAVALNAQGAPEVQRGPATPVAIVDPLPVPVSGSVDVSGAIGASPAPSVVESIRELGAVFLESWTQPESLDLGATHYVTSLDVFKLSGPDDGPFLVSLRLDGVTTTSMSFKDLEFVTLPIPVAADEVSINCFSADCASGSIGDGVIVNGYPAP